VGFVFGCVSDEIVPLLAVSVLLFVSTVVSLVAQFVARRTFGLGDVITIVDFVVSTTAVCTLRAFQVLGILRVRRTLGIRFLGLCLRVTFLPNSIEKRSLGGCKCGSEITIAILAIAIQALAILLITFSNKFMNVHVAFVWVSGKLSSEIVPRRRK
jgi:hypothetical protein